MNSHRVLIAVDVQEGFLRDVTAHVPAAIVRLALSGQYGHIWATRFTNPGPDGPFHRFMAWTRFAPDAPESNVDAQVLRVAQRVFDKSTYRAPQRLVDAAMELRASPIDVCGIDTDVCVLTVATQLFDEGLQVRVLAAASGSHGGAASHAAGLTVLRRILGRGGVVDDALDDLVRVPNNARP